MALHPSQKLDPTCLLVLWLTIWLGVVSGASNAFISTVRSTNHRVQTFQSTSLFSINPNDLETPEEREQRMQLVRQLQKSFYNDEEGISIGKDGMIQDLPLWRVQWTELPGYQNVLNCHVAHYTHMFMKIVSGPKPWYFGHLLLPGGSENLSNPMYNLGEKNSMASTTGVLMRVSDYEQLDDGRLLLIVQAMERFEVTEATQHAPYAIANVRIRPDAELMIRNGEKIELNTIVQDARQWESFEFRGVSVDECSIDRGLGVSPLINYDADSLSGTDATTDEEEDESFESVLQLERDVWIALDKMIQLLAALNPNPEKIQVPIPTQLLGLLPMYQDWPDDFYLEMYTSGLSDNKSTVVGTGSKSPFCRVDEAASSYPAIRRARRLSFVVWVLLEAIAIDGEGSPVTRQDILEFSSVARRLQAAKVRINAINRALGQAKKL